MKHLSKNSRESIENDETSIEETSVNKANTNKLKLQKLKQQIKSKRQ
jgi:hypothetical protein